MLHLVKKNFPESDLLNQLFPSSFTDHCGNNVNNATHYKKTLNKILLIALNMLTLQGYMSSDRILALYFLDEIMDLFKQSVKKSPTSIQFFSIFRLDIKLLFIFPL